ncbi:uncharacterized protein LOC112568088 isoform X3 [Pomacea canaliculata]|uniref:uncharacterized protein LOC112568088 isoform X3 n=1 Tax=Pomacea canaliculata TaxID=400727 RepID=UPI000D73C760|nr:uncharacterized protein LOC112568088 isoform X3 [Pomacea canaliculata]
MGLLSELVSLGVVLCLTVSGSNAQCGEQQHNAFLDCVHPYLSSFAPLTTGSSCNRKLITAGLCTNFATIMRCVNDINNSSTCMCDAVSPIREKISFACTLSDLQEACTEGRNHDTVDERINRGHTEVVGDVGDAGHTTTSSSEECSTEVLRTSTSLGDGGTNGGDVQAFVDGASLQCGDQEHTAFMDCVFPYISSFAPLTTGSSCNRKLITAGLCKMFATIVQCVNNINASSTCRRDAVNLMREQMNFACKLSDLQETCTDAPTLDTGEIIHTTTSSSKASQMQTMESASVGGKPVTGSAVPSRASLVLLMMYTILLVLLLRIS